MEEKRYKLESYNEAFCEIHDTEKDEWYIRKDLIVDLLNQQLKRIKELENDIVNYKYISSRGSELLKVNQNQEHQIAELQEKVKKLEYDNGELTSLIDAMRYEDPKIDELQKQLEASETQNKRVLEKLELITKSNQDLEKQLEGKEKELEHWHKLYQERDRQFQSVRQRYHLLNELQSNYDKKDKLQLLEMQCLELVNENEQLKKENGYIVFSDGYDKNGNEIHRQEFVKYKEKFKELIEENNQLKQSQKQLAISKLEKIKENFGYKYNSQLMVSSKRLCDFIDDQIKELKGEMCEKSKDVVNMKKIFYLSYLIITNYDDIMLYNDWMIEDYEQEDMDNFYERYPNLKIIPFNVMLYLQRYYNSEVLNAGWCTTANPDALIKFLKKMQEVNKENGKEKKLL